jgi:hypothetical protein
MKIKICLLLAVLLLLSMTSCAAGNDDPAQSSGELTDSKTEVATEDPNYHCDIPVDLKFGGQEVSVLYNPIDGRGDELVSEEIGHGVVSDAVYERNIAVEEMLEVVLNYMDSENIGTDMLQDIQSGLGEYQIIANGTNQSVIPVIEGQYINLDALDNIDTSKHYWTQGYNDMATFTDEDIQFLASGPIALSMYRFMFLTIYNKVLFGEYQVEDLYDTVHNGDWTLDYQYAIVKDHYYDADGDQKHSEGDFYGFVTGDTISVDPYPVASNVHMIVKAPDSGDLMYNTEVTARLSDLCDKVQLIYNDESVYVYKTGDYDNMGTNYVINLFSSQKALMATTMFYAMELNYESLGALTYGIAPMPKFDKNQANYQTYVQDRVSCYGISAAVGSEDVQEMCAAVLEAMAYHSWKLVRPAYCETVLSTRYMQDPQSKDMLEVVFDSLKFDFSSAWSDILGTSNIRNQLRPILSGNKNIVASSTRSWQRSVQRTLDGYNEKLSEYESQ